MARREVSSDRTTEPQVKLHDEFENGELTDEEILESIRRGMEDVKAGRTRAARQAIAEVRSRLAADDNAD